jgi:hypothetical protein
MVDIVIITELSMAALDLEKRRTFVAAYVETGNATRAAIRAGVPAASARTMGARWLAHPDIRDMMREEVGNALRALAPGAIKTLHDLVNDPSTPAPTRLAAANSILDRLGFQPPKRVAAEVHVATDDLTKLSRAELERLATGLPLEGVGVEASV